MATVLERQLDAAQKIVHIGSWGWEIATGVVTWSDELYRIYGLEPGVQPITLEFFLERVHPDDRPRIGRTIQEALARGGRFAYRERIRRPDGSVRQLDTIGDVLTDHEGKAAAMIGTCRDITEELRLEEQVLVYADIAAHTNIGFSVWKQDDATTFRLLAFNRAAVRATGVALDGHIGKSLSAIFPIVGHTELPACMAAISAEHPTAELPAYRFDPSPRAATFAVKVFALPDACVGLAVEDVSERTRAQILQVGERQVLERLAAGAPLGELLDALARLMEQAAGDVLASILLLDDQGMRLVHGAAPSLPASYVRAIDGALIGPAVGSCGTAAFRREAVYVADIQTDPLWADYREVALAAGLRACWSSPIFGTDGRVLGTFALYYRDARTSDPDLKTLVERASHVAAIVIERRRLDDQLRALNDRIEAVREDERTAISREIHDQLGQALTVLKMDITWVARHLGETSVGEKLAAMAGTADEIIETMRHLAAELRPGMLDDLGLAATIQWQAAEFERRTGTAVGIDAALGDVTLSRELATAVFRIFQETLTNIARHAAASYVDVKLWIDGVNLHLDVADDGVGMPAVPSRGGALGLLGMRERAHRLGGECVVRPNPPHGTTVALTVPLAAGA